MCKLNQLKTDMKHKTTKKTIRKTIQKAQKISFIKLL